MAVAAVTAVEETDVAAADTAAEEIEATDAVAAVTDQDTKLQLCLVKNFFSFFCFYNISLQNRVGNA